MANSLPRLDDRARESLPGPDNVLRQELPNGMVVLARESYATPSVNFTMGLKVGALEDPLGQRGLADLTAAALTRGTQSRSFMDIFETLEAHGAMLGVGAGAHTTSVSAKGLTEDFGLLLDLASDVMINPTFPDAEVDLLRSQKLTSLAIRDEQTQAVAQRAFQEMAYDEHPYRFFSDGYSETIAPLVAEDLRRFHHDHYGPRGMIVVVVGAVSSKDAIAAVVERMGSWENSRQSPRPKLPPLKELAERTRRNISMAGKVQCDIIIGAPGPRRVDDDYLAAALGNSALGQFGLMGRIGEVVREKAGLAYYAYSSLVSGLGPGPWQVSAGVDPGNLEQAIDLILEELSKLYSDGITAEELRDNHSNFIGRLPLRLESNMGVASALMHLEQYQLGLDYYRRFPDLVAGTTQDNILGAVRRFLDPNRLAIAVAGPVDGDG
jgi:zinc protease